MKKLLLTDLKALYKNEQKNGATLRSNVLEYVIDRWNDYERKSYIFTEVLEHGCESGIVGHLIYYRDTISFYRKYRNEINSLVTEYCRELGCNPSDLIRRFDTEDWLCIEEWNQNLLAWFGFEVTLNRLYNELCEEYEIE